MLCFREHAVTRQAGADAVEKFERWRLSVHIQNLGQRVAEGGLRFGEPDGMDVRFDQIFIGQIQSGWSDRPRDHAVLLTEEILIVGISRGAIGEYKGGLATSSGTATALCVVGGRWGDIAHIDHVELPDIDPELHRGGTIHDWQRAGAKIFFPFFSFVVRDLGRMFACLKSATLARHFPIKIDEEWVCATTRFGRIGDSNRVMKSDLAVGDVPNHGGCRELITGNAIVAGRLNRFDKVLGLFEDAKEISQDRVFVYGLDGLAGLFKFWQRPFATDEQTKTAPSGQIRVIQPVVRLA